MWSCDPRFVTESFYGRSYRNLSFVRIWLEKPISLRGAFVTETKYDLESLHQCDKRVKTRKFYRLLPTLIDVTGKNLVLGDVYNWSLIPSRINITCLEIFIAQSFRNNSFIPIIWRFRRTFMPNFDFNRVVKQLYWNLTSSWMIYCKFTAYF